MLNLSTFSALTSRTEIQIFLSILFSHL